MEKLRSLWSKLVSSDWVIVTASDWVIVTAKVAAVAVVLLSLASNVFRFANAPQAVKHSYPNKLPTPRQVPKSIRSTHNVCELGEGNNCQVQIFFATDRKPSGSVVPANFFTGNRSVRDDPLAFGTLHVSIPAVHKVGDLEEPAWWSWRKSDPNKDLVILDLQLTPKEEFVSSLAEAVQNSESQEALIFIHGYHVSFDEAARRTAQLAWDLQFGGVPILYSWPSKGNVFYSADEASAYWAVPHLKRFLQLVAQESGARTIHIVAHSLGNRALMYALQQIALEHSSSGPRFREIVLAAPDVDNSVFKDLAEAFPSTANHVTIYASSHDKALGLSKLFHDNSSMGKITTLTKSLGSQVDLIDASSMSEDLLSLDHSYYAGNVAVLEDMGYLIRKGLPPGERLLLDPHPATGTPLYWTFRH